MYRESPVQAGKHVAFVTITKGRLLAVGVALTISGSHQADPQEKAVGSNDQTANAATHLIRNA